MESLCMHEQWKYLRPLDENSTSEWAVEVARVFALCTQPIKLQRSLLEVEGF